jgi:hypothetical protein
VSRTIQHASLRSLKSANPAKASSPATDNRGPVCSDIRSSTLGFLGWPPNARSLSSIPRPGVSAPPDRGGPLPQLHDEFARRALVVMLISKDAKILRRNCEMRSDSGRDGPQQIMGRDRQWNSPSMAGFAKTKGNRQTWAA